MQFQGLSGFCSHFPTTRSHGTRDLPESINKGRTSSSSTISWNFAWTRLRYRVAMAVICVAGVDMAMAGSYANEAERMACWARTSPLSVVSDYRGRYLCIADRKVRTRQHTTEKVEQSSYIIADKAIIKVQDCIIMSARAMKATVPGTDTLMPVKRVRMKSTSPGKLAPPPTSTTPMTRRGSVGTEKRFRTLS